ncbi:hypothetical protein SAMN05216275_10751 [Streptosporangium canum]|uniref:Uncharacterized protein n=1 Tax=Streptosporangium canum TaxID=324952 RepID=A0A1I3PEC2_9ACTN|nr:hypothetical protein SAMN05216275_10751 [Streptosporangium canum]
MRASRAADTGSTWSSMKRTGPQAPRNPAASSASRPHIWGASTGSEVTASKPAPVSTSRMRSGSASDSGPGAPGPVVAGRAGRCSAIVVKTGPGSLSLISRRDRKASRPPGRSARPMLANAATGSAKNMIPNRLTATSKPSTGRVSTGPPPADLLRRRRCRGQDLSRCGEDPSHASRKIIISADCRSRVPRSAHAGRGGRAAGVRNGVIRIGRWSSCTTSERMPAGPVRRGPRTT